MSIETLNAFGTNASAWIFTFVLGLAFFLTAYGLSYHPKLRFAKQDLLTALLASLWPILWETAIEVLGFYANLWHIIPPESSFREILLASFLMGIRFYFYHLVLSILYYFTYIQENQWLRFLPVVVMVSIGACSDLFIGHLEIFPLLDPLVWFGLEFVYFLTYKWLYQILHSRFNRFEWHLDTACLVYYRPITTPVYPVTETLQQPFQRCLNSRFNRFNSEDIVVHEDYYTLSIPAS